MIMNILAVDIQQAFANVETWIAAAIAFLTTTAVGGVILGIIIRLLTKKVNKQTTVSEAKIKKASKDGATLAIKNMVGKSFNVNIKAEVDKAVKEEMKPIRENAEYAAVAARNSEFATAYVLMAQSKSRLLTKEEQENLQLIAKKLLDHADGKIVEQARIEVSIDASAESEPISHMQESKSANENATFVSFDDVD